MKRSIHRLTLTLAACGLAAGCAVSPAAYPGRTSIPPPMIQPVDLKLGVIPYGRDSGDRLQDITDQMRALGLLKAVGLADPANPDPAALFDVLLDLRGMGLTSDRVAGLIAAGTGKTIYSWKPDCGMSDSWCINPGNLARDVAWLLAGGTPLRADLKAEMKRAASLPKEGDAPPADQPPANAEKPWWESGSKK